MTNTIAITGVDRAKNQLYLQFRADSLRFTTTYWYSDVDFHELEQHHGLQLMERVYFHIAAFEITKLASLQPRWFDVGPYTHCVTQRFIDLWTTVINKVWAQWRFENGLPDYPGPRMTAAPSSTLPTLAELPPAPPELLAFCGGGKDSLAALKLLERANLPYASLAYSSSVYGSAAPQHALIDRLLDRCTPSRRHHQWIYDDFMDSPVRELTGTTIKTLTAAETPASIFGAVPLLLQHGYRYMTLGHEASANKGNLVWPATGEEINHQWGKSLEAELLLDDYLGSELVPGARCFSLLQPIHDPLIFFLLNQDLGAVKLTHSCNVRKPWCETCPKCAYVYLGYLAYLPVAAVEPIFSTSLFDATATQRAYEMMLGLGEHTPFECIGQVDETRLAFELCLRKGLRGAAVDRYRANARLARDSTAPNRYLTVASERSRMPNDVAAGVIPQLQRAAREARGYVQRILSQ